MIEHCVVALCAPDLARPGELRERIIIALIHVISPTPMIADEPSVVNVAKVEW